MQSTSRLTALVSLCAIAHIPSTPIAHRAWVASGAICVRAGWSGLKLIGIAKRRNLGKERSATLVTTMRNHKLEEFTDSKAQSARLLEPHSKTRNLGNQQNAICAARERNLGGSGRPVIPVQIPMPGVLHFGNVVEYRIPSVFRLVYRTHQVSADQICVRSVRAGRRKGFFGLSDF